MKVGYMPGKKADFTTIQDTDFPASYCYISNGEKCGILPQNFYNHRAHKGVTEI